MNSGTNLQRSSWGPNRNWLFVVEKNRLQKGFCIEKRRSLGQKSIKLLSGASQGEGKKFEKLETKMVEGEGRYKSMRVKRFGNKGTMKACYDPQLF